MRFRAHGPALARLWSPGNHGVTLRSVALGTGRAAEREGRWADPFTLPEIFTSTGTGKNLRPATHGYTSGMKTAVSVPDDVFEKVERLARRSRKSRSEVFSAALREYVARHAPDEVTESLNAVCDSLGETSDPFVAEASRRVLENSDW